MSGVKKRYEAVSKSIATCSILPRMWVLLLSICVGIATAALPDEEIILIKIGGSSITNKAVKEELNPKALDWFAKTLAKATHQQRFVIVHGAGSFGHFTAKEYGLTSRDGPPPIDNNINDTFVCSDEPEEDTTSTSIPEEDTDKDARAYRMKGLSVTRLSVQKLNNAVVASLVQHGLNAIGISPCFGIPGVQAHGGDTQGNLPSVVWTAVQAGLIPVLHGDACLWGRDNVGILSGDTILERLGVMPWVSRAIFLTDVDGIYTADPRRDPTATLIPTLLVNTTTGRLMHPSVVNAQESHHEHDVTGGLKVCTWLSYMHCKHY